MFSRTSRHRSLRRASIGTLVAAAAALGLATGATPASAKRAETPAVKPTIVLVHGAFADASGWTGVTNRLEDRGYEVLAPANPLRGVSADAAYLRTYLSQIPGPIVLVGHSYGGFVITDAATGNPNVKALVYVAAFAPDLGDSVQSLGALVPGGQINESTLNVTLFPTPTGELAPEATIKKSVFRDIFAADLPRRQVSAMAAAQRPAALQALGEPSAEPAWKTIKSYYEVAGRDNAIGTKLERFMAKRIGAKTIEIPGASHVVFISHPDITAALIVAAARS